jgi:tetratricopeptide (TPR) repeat protein
MPEGPRLKVWLTGELLVSGSESRYARVITFVTCVAPFWLSIPAVCPPIIFLYSHRNKFPRGSPLSGESLAANQSMGKSRENTFERPKPWIYNPALDLVVGCGGWSAPLLLVSYFSLASAARMWSVVFYVLALFFNYPHYMATIYRAYHRAEDFQKYRVFTLHITLLMALTLVLSHLWVGLLPWIFTLYLTWSPWHYSGQNYGLLMMFARRAGASVDKATQQALYGAFIASYLVLFLGFHTGPSSDPLFISLGIPAVISRWEQVILMVAFVGLSAFAFARLTRSTGWKPLIPSLVLFSSQFLWFLLPAALTMIKGWEIPQNRYSSGVLAVMHSAQYLWITSYYARREAAGEPSSARSKPRTWRPLGYFGVLMLGGIALFVPGPWMASRVLHHDFTASFLIFTALVNIHHFILDGALWKLRDGRIASLLLNSRDSISQAAAQTGSRLAGAARWLAGESTGARALRVSTAVLLLAWGTVDQARYYFSLRTDDLHDLERAAALNAFDSSVQKRLARRAMEDGEMQQAEAAWRRAIAANPGDPSMRQALLQFLIEQNRYADAYQLTEPSLQYMANDGNLLFDRGILNLQRGHAEQARADWERALAVDPGQTNAHLYLAQELDHEGHAAAAAWHYGAYLAKVAARKGERPAPDKIIALVLRMADCQARSSQFDVAFKSYHLAEQLAIQTHQPKLQSVADVNEAAVQAKAGRWSAALPLYQEALRLDASVNDDAASAQDWLAFGVFLDNAGYPPRLAYACLVKSQKVRATMPANEDPAKGLRAPLEKSLGATAGAIARDPQAAAAEALELRP